MAPASLRPHFAFALLPLAAAAAGLAQQGVAVGPAAGGGYLVPTGQLIRPAGQSVSFGGRPVDLVASPDARWVYVKDDRGLVVLDTVSWKVVQELKLAQGGGSMHGIAVSPSGRTVYLTTALDALWEAAIGSDGRAAWGRKITLPGPAGGPSHACGLALDPTQDLAYVCLSRNNTVGVVDLKAGKLVRELPTGIAPWDVVQCPDGTLCISNWGGRHPGPRERHAPSSGTETLVDERGIAASGTVSRLDPDSGRQLWQTETGLHPSDLELTPEGRLFVANANSDTVVELDWRTGRILNSLEVRPDRNLPYGSAPGGLAWCHLDNRLYAADGGSNALAVISVAGGGMRLDGFIPTGWYPGALAASSSQLYVTNVKGYGSRRPEGSAWKAGQFLGTVDRLPPASPGLLARYTTSVRENTRVRDIRIALRGAREDRGPVPIPERAGEPSVFRHVVYIIKENRTYDQVLGDIGRGNSDPKLCIYGREITPNHHALAEQFVLLDNFYCNGVVSADGHSWATEGNVTDHLEKSFGGFTRSYTFGDDPLTYSSSGFLWDNALAHGLTFRNFGEMDYTEPIPANASWSEIYRDYTGKTGRIRFTHQIGVARMRRYAHPDSLGWNLKIPDALRADVFIRDLRAAEASGEWPNLTILYLPQDHTSGTTPGTPTPRAYVADNDLALGRVIEAISRSRFWAETCVFVVEDDPQDGFDHVDGHRSVCLVASPYTRRGAVVSRFYNQTGVLHTMERILSLPPMNQMDAMAPLMRDCFVSRPDLRPFTALPNRIPLDEMNSPARALNGEALKWARASQRQNFRQIDQADEDTLNRILWHAARGDSARYPVEWSGAHGKGLARLGLRRDQSRADID